MDGERHASSKSGHRHLDNRAASGKSDFAQWWDYSWHQGRQIGRLLFQVGPPEMDARQKRDSVLHWDAGNTFGAYSPGSSEVVKLKDMLEAVKASGDARRRGLDRPPPRPHSGAALPHDLSSREANLPSGNNGEDPYGDQICIIGSFSADQVKHDAS